MQRGSPGKGKRGKGEGARVPGEAVTSLNAPSKLWTNKCISVAHKQISKRRRRRQQQMSAENKILLALTLSSSS